MVDWGLLSWVLLSLLGTSAAAAAAAAVPAPAAAAAVAAVWKL